MEPDLRWWTFLIIITMCACCVRFHNVGARWSVGSKILIDFTKPRRLDFALDDALSDGVVWY